MILEANYRLDGMQKIRLTSLMITFSLIIWPYANYRFQKYALKAVLSIKEKVGLFNFMYNKSCRQWILTSVFLAVTLQSLFLINCSKKENFKANNINKSEFIVGVWTRPIRNTVEGMEGLNIMENGSLDLVGIYSMKGLGWKIDGDSLSLITNTGRYPEPFESKFLIETLTDSMLKLSLSGGYFGGFYKRQTSAKISGTVTYRQRIALPSNAAIQVVLTDITQLDVKAEIVAEQTIRTDGQQVPIPFELAYNPAIIKSNHTYSVRAKITSDNKTIFESTKRHLVITRGNPTKIEVLVNPA
jgi:uncharacterized lipoprotein YbaY